MILLTVIEIYVESCYRIFVHTNIMTLNIHVHVVQSSYQSFDVMKLAELFYLFLFIYYVLLRIGTPLSISDPRQTHILNVV